MLLCNRFKLLPSSHHISTGVQCQQQLMGKQQLSNGALGCQSVTFVIILLTLTDVVT